jgi:hypothetical protein
VSAVLATIPEETARKVADDIRDFGHGYLRIDHEGRAEYVPSYLVVDPAREEPRGTRRVHE